MDKVNERLSGLGANPHALHANDWARFGDMLTKDADIKTLTFNSYSLRREIKLAGGVAAMWRSLYPKETQFLYARYGYPSENRRSTIQYVPHPAHQASWPYQAQWWPPQTHYQPQPHWQPGSQPTWPSHSVSQPQGVVAGCASDSDYSYSEAEEEAEQSGNCQNVEAEKVAARPPSPKQTDQSGNGQNVDAEKVAARPPSPKLTDQSGNCQNVGAEKVDASLPNEAVVAGSHEQKHMEGGTKIGVDAKRTGPKTTWSIDVDLDSDSSSDTHPSRGQPRSQELPPRHRSRSAKPRRPPALGVARDIKERAADLWIIAGDEALHSNFLKSLKTASSENGWNLRFLSLPSKNVLHTGVALCQVLLYLDADKLNATASTALHCVVSERSLKRWPTSHQSAHKNRLDNVNHCLRSFGIDGHNSPGQSMLRSSLQTFMVMGDGPIALIDVPAYRQRLSFLGKRALSDENFVEEVVYASLSTPHRARNGMQLWTDAGKETETMLTTMLEVSGTGRNVEVVVMDPSGQQIM